MEKYKNINKEIWVKRTFANGEVSRPVKMKISAIDEIKKAQDFNILKGASPMFTLKRMPLIYSPYRYIYERKEKAIWFVVGATVAAILERIFSK